MHTYPFTIINASVKFTEDGTRRAQLGNRELTTVWKGSAPSTPSYTPLGNSSLRIPHAHQTQSETSCMHEAYPDSANFAVAAKLVPDHTEGSLFYQASISLLAQWHPWLQYLSPRCEQRNKEPLSSMRLFALRSPLQITSFTELNTGRPRWVCPPFPGEIPPTSWVP